MEVEIVDRVQGPVSPHIDHQRASHIDHQRASYIDHQRASHIDHQRASHIDHQRASGLLTPSPSLSGSPLTSGDEDDEAGFNVDYDQAYRMLARTFGLENSRDATSLSSQTQNTPGQYSTAGGVGGTARVPPREQQPLPAPASPPLTSLPGVHVFNNATPTVPVTMPSPNNTTPQQGNLPPPPTAHGVPQFMPPTMRNQGNIFPPPNQMMQNSYHSNNSYYGNAGNVNMPNNENHANNLAALFRSFLQNGGSTNNNGSNLSSMFGALPEQILMENMMNFNQNNQNMQQQGPVKRQGGPRNYKRGRAPSAPMRAPHAPNMGGYNMQQPPQQHMHHGIASPQQQQQPPLSASTPWGFYMNRDMDFSTTFPYPQLTPPDQQQSGTG